MIYLYAYLGIGAVALAVIFIAHRMTRSAVADEVAELLQAGDPRRGRWWWKPMNNVVVPLLAALAVLLFWPVTIVWKLQELIAARRPEQSEAIPPRKFAVAREHLGKPLALAEIEAAEIVSDPAGAVPQVPFGHLNPVWESFKQSIQDGDQLWSFSALWQLEWGGTDVREGYVIVREDSVGAYFLARRAPAEREGEDRADVSPELEPLKTTL